MQKPREIVPEVANVGRGRERTIVGREQRTAAETRSGVDREVEPRIPESRPSEAREESGYAGRVDREDPQRGLGATQSGERQSHDLPGVGNRPAR